MRLTWPIVNPLPRRYLGLGWWRRGGELRRPDTAPYPRAPWGWRWLRDENMWSAVCLPLWLYWPAQLWRGKWGYLLEPFMRLGLWTLNEAEGGFYYDGRPTFPLWVRRAWWCFLHDRDTAPEACQSCGRLAEGGPPTGLLGWYACPACVDRRLEARLAARRAMIFINVRSPR